MLAGTTTSRIVRGVVILVAAVVVVNLGLRLVAQLAGGPEPTGSRGSSYATAPEGAAAYADLLTRSGYRVHRLRVPLTEMDLDPSATLVLLDPPSVEHEDAQALREFAEAGGRLVVGADDPWWLSQVMDHPAAWASVGVREAGVVVPLSETRGIRRVVTSGRGAWVRPGQAVPALAGDEGALLAVAAPGNGRIVLLADTSPLQNELLAEADNAALGLAIAGDPGSRVFFAESVHGFGEAVGLDAIPVRWRLALVGLLLATLVWMWARGRRLGEPEFHERQLAPSRRLYVEAMASALERTRRPQEASEPIRAAVRATIVRRTGLSPDAGDHKMRSAAKSLGLSEDEIGAVLRPGSGEQSLMAAGRALARLRAGQGRIGAE